MTIVARYANLFDAERYCAEFNRLAKRGVINGNRKYAVEHRKRGGRTPFVVVRTQ